MLPPGSHNPGRQCLIILFLSVLQVQWREPTARNWRLRPTWMGSWWAEPLWSRSLSTSSTHVRKPETQNVKAAPPAGPIENTLPFSSSRVTVRLQPGPTDPHRKGNFFFSVICGNLFVELQNEITFFSICHHITSNAFRLDHHFMFKMWCFLLLVTHMVSSRGSVGPRCSLCLLTWSVSHLTALTVTSGSVRIKALNRMYLYINIHIYNVMCIQSLSFVLKGQGLLL